MKKILVAVTCLLVCGGMAAAQTRSGKGPSELVLLTMASVEECVMADELLRQSCSRVGAHLSGENKKYCEAVATPFEARTARPYAAFKQANRDEINAYEADIAKVIGKVKRSFERQYADMRAGKVSMLDLERLSGLMADRCQTIEQLLVAKPKPR